MNLTRFIPRQYVTRAALVAARAGESISAYPTTAGVTLNNSQFGAHRTTGGSSRKNRKSGDCEPFESDRV